MNKPFWTVGWIVLIQLAVVLLLVPGDWTAKAIDREKEMIRTSLGEISHRWISEKADSWHQFLVWDSGVYTSIHNHLIPTQEQKESSKGIENMGRGWFAWVAGRIEAVSQVVHQALVRAALIIVWAPYIALLLFPAVFDGLMSWRIKRTNFDYSSPVIHRYSMRLTGIVCVLLTMILAAPFAVNPIVIPVAMMICCVCFGLIFGNLPKRV